MRNHWFRKAGWVYKPISFSGWVITLAVAMFLINTLIAASLQSRSMGDILYGIFPYWVGALGIWLWIAGNTSREK